MSKLNVADLESHAPESRAGHFIHLSDETVKALDVLASTILAERNFTPDAPLTKREVQRMRTDWNVNAPPSIRNRRQMLNMSSGFYAGDQYMDVEFYKAHPECVLNTKQGRPSWYIHPQKQWKLARGEAIALLINLAGDQLLKNLTPKTDEKNKRTA